MPLPQLEQPPSNAGMIQQGMGQVGQGLGDFLQGQQELPPQMQQLLNQMMQDPVHAAALSNMANGMPPDVAAVHAMAIKAGAHPNGAAFMSGGQPPTQGDAAQPSDAQGSPEMLGGDVAPQPTPQQAMAPPSQATTPPVSAQSMYKFKVKDLAALKQIEPLLQVQEQAKMRAEIAEQNRISRENIEIMKEQGRGTRSDVRTGLKGKELDEKQREFDTAEEGRNARNDANIAQRDRAAKLRAMTAQERNQISIHFAQQAKQELGAVNQAQKEYDNASKALVDYTNGQARAMSSQKDPDYTTRTADLQKHVDRAKKKWETLQQQYLSRFNFELPGETP